MPRLRRSASPSAVALLAFVGASVFAAAAAPQVPAGPPVVPARPVSPTPWGMSAEESAAYEKARADYQKCIREHESAMRLASLADDVIGVRERRSFFESELARNHTLRSTYPGGYDQMLAVTFEQYRSAGGTAASANEVRPVKPPCTPPTGTTQGTRSPVTESRSMVVPQKR